MNAIMNKAQLATDLLNTLFEYVQMEHPGYQTNLEEGDLGEFIKAFLAKKYSEIEDKEFVLNVEIEDKKIMTLFDKKLITVRASLLIIGKESQMVIQPLYRITIGNMIRRWRQ